MSIVLNFDTNKNELQIIFHYGTLIIDNFLKSSTGFNTVLTLQAQEKLIKNLVSNMSLK